MLGPEHQVEWTPQKPSIWGLGPERQAAGLRVQVLRNEQTELIPQKRSIRELGPEPQAAGGPGPERQAVGVTEGVGRLSARK